MSAKRGFDDVSGCGISALVVILGLMYGFGASATQLSIAGLFILGLMLWGWWLCFLTLTSGHVWHWFRTRQGWGLDIAELARRLDVDFMELKEHQPEYVERFIPKRSGGSRRLLIPDAATAELQKKILKRLLGKLRAHDCAMGFEKGRSIVDNALPHVGQAVVIKLDVVDFFPSTTEERVEAYFRRIGWNRETAKLLVRLTCHEGALPQGAATSPRLSNLINYLLDVQLRRLADWRKGEYTRYADDITFSFPKDYPRRIRGVAQMARRILKRHGYALNNAKQKILRQHQRQSVTGLNVNTKACLPRKLRRQLRAARHRLEQTGEATWTEEQLTGWAALEQMVAEQAKDDVTFQP